MCNEKTKTTKDDNNDDKKTFLRMVSKEEAEQYPEYDGVNDVVDIEDAD
jgi:hypothetical protein